ncbi:hypothetical protein [Aliiroseovarius sp. 2305UL8-7]|uniref:hypothetical protein n=1 Tax=Aliiroseovarius conchicola TaxID=3121637 RepID=UPI0035278EB3
MSAHSTKQRLKLLAIVATGFGIVFLHFSPPNLPSVSGDFIPYDQLATEETDPLLVGGAPPVEGGSAIKLAKRYDNVRDCLERSERKAEVPDLRKFAWLKMRSYDVASVCLFRVFSSLGTPERSKLWLESQGLKVSVSPTKNDILVSAVNLLKESNSRLIGGRGISGKVFTFIASRSEHRESITSWWSHDGTLLGASISYISL